MAAVMPSSVWRISRRASAGRERTSSGLSSKTTSLSEETTRPPSGAVMNRPRSVASLEDSGRVDRIVVWSSRSSSTALSGMVSDTSCGASEISGALTEATLPCCGQEIFDCTWLTGRKGVKTSRTKAIRPETIAV